MNAITSNLYVLKYIKERNAELKTESNWNRIPCLLLSQHSYVTLCSSLLYKMWIITYLTDACEKLFENLEVGFIVTHSASGLAFLLDNLDTDRMSILF